MPREAADPPTKTCANCGKTFHRRRDSTGRLQHASQWRAQLACCISCARAVTSARTVEAKPQPHCASCGKPMPKTTVKRSRATCSRACALVLSGRRSAEVRERNLANQTHDPCTHCGKDVPRRRNEPASVWLRRRTCSTDCAIARGYDTAKQASKTRSRRKRAGRLAPEGYVFDGRFPTPKAARPKWQTITGPDTTPATPRKRPARAMRGVKTAAALRKATHAHPDLRDVLLDLLTGAQ